MEVFVSGQDDAFNDAIAQQQKYSPHEQTCN